MKKLIIILLSMGISAHAFCQSPYFYKQHGDFYVQNGLDIEESNGEIFVCGDMKNTSDDVWNGFIYKFDEYGNTSEVNVVEDSLTSTNRRLVVSNEYLYVFGSRDIYNASGNFKGVFAKHLKEDLGIEIRKSYDEKVETYLGLKQGEYLYTGGFFKDDTPAVDYWQPYLTKLDSMGNQVWEQVYEGFEYNNRITEIAPIFENELVVLANINFSPSEDIANMLMLRINDAGEILWEKTIDFGSIEYSSGLVIKNDGIVVGFRQIGVNAQFNYNRLVKYDFEGNIIWMSDPFLEDCELADLIESKDGYIIGAGCARTEGNEVDMALTKFDSEGTQLWTRTYGFVDGPEIAYQITIDDKNRIIATGRTETNTDNIADLLLVKTNCMGLMTEPQAEYTYEQDDSLTFAFENLSEFVYPDSIDGGHYLWDFGDGTLSTEENPTHSYSESSTYEVSLMAVVCQDTAIYTACLYLDENTLCCADVEELPIVAFSDTPLGDSLNIAFTNQSQNLYEDYNNGASFLWDFGDGSSSSEFSPSHSYTNAGVYDISLSLVFCNDTSILEYSLLVGDTTQTALYNLALVSSIQVYPNPSSGAISFSFAPNSKERILHLYDSTGKLLREITLPAMSEGKNLFFGDWSKGIYFWQLGRESGKILLE